MYKFSIVLPLYNGMPYLKECIDSIYSQTYTNFDLIVLDSGSTDDSLQFIKTLSKPNVTIYNTDCRLYIEQNWARIKDIPKAEYMTIIGQDDILYPTFLEEINGLIDRNENASLWHTHFDYVDAFGKVIRACEKMPLNLTLTNIARLFLVNQLDMMGTGYVMRSADYDRIGGIPLNYPSLLFADFELWFKLTGLSYEAISEKKLFAFRIHQSTTTTSKNAIFIKAFIVFVEFLNQLKSTSPELEKIIKNNSDTFISKYAQRLTHRVIKTELRNRNNDETVKSVLQILKNAAYKLNPQTKFNSPPKLNIKAALLIDTNNFTRSLFLLYKKIFPKAILK